MRYALQTLALASTATLSACGGMLPVSDGPKTLTLFEDPNTNAIGTAQIAVRTYVESAGTKTEVAGAACTIQSRQTRGSIVSPQVALVPKFEQTAELPNRGKPDDLQVTCTYGDRSGSATVYALRHPADLGPAQAGQTPTSLQTVSVGGGVAAEVGNALGGAITQGIYKSFNWTYIYSPANVTLR